MLTLLVAFKKSWGRGAGNSHWELSLVIKREMQHNNEIPPILL